MLQSKRNTSVSLSEWRLYLHKCDCLRANCDSIEESITILVTTAVQPQRSNYPEAKPHSHGHGMISILKWSGIIERATKPKDTGLMTWREQSWGSTWESKFPASDFSSIKLLGKQRFSFKLQPLKKPDCDKQWCFRTRVIYKWKIIASIFSGALLKYLRNRLMTKTIKSSDKYKHTMDFNTIFKSYFYVSGILLMKIKIFCIDSYGARGVISPW